MGSILNILGSFQVYIVIALLVLFIILLILVIINIKALNRLENKYKKLMKGTNSKNLEELILDYMNKINDMKEETDSIKNIYNKLNIKLSSCIQKYSIVRYKAFEDIGSDLSFSIAFLDENNNGIIITSIYGREESMTYAKPIDNGISRYDLSNEEKEALDKAMHKPA
ncbi:hypothetical protein CLOACE_17660 [Clostridium acetireducens DSM 10703]|uniref:DUF4446 domain-containing protein n=1 Tax=Clostridium acetireducens DSM 10703 TaxID=1121290 RepID=A0A1E8EX66_9CLOT|nr:DUF4446 family protein [Clostridium acetireducens]OFI05389.1 hypothetical protein CLOACE_17660 [Clostridium acetireducens DSM 10703]